MNAATKGKRGEREVRDIFRAFGIDCERTPNSGAMRWKGDLADLEERGIHTEVKRQERLRIPEWLKQTHDDCPDGALPLLALRQSKARGANAHPLGEWHGMTPLPQLVALLAVWHGAMTREDAERVLADLF